MKEQCAKLENFSSKQDIHDFRKKKVQQPRGNADVQLTLRNYAASHCYGKFLSRTRDFAELRHDLNITRSRGLSRAHPGEKQTRSHAGTLADSAYFRKLYRAKSSNLAVPTRSLPLTVFLENLKLEKRIIKKIA